MNFKLIFFLYISFLNCLFSQIKGFIVDSNSGEPIGGVNIFSGEEGTSSNQNGKFILNIPIDSKITFSHVGYREIIVSADEKMNVRMDILFIQQEEIIIRSGLSQQSLESLHSSITVIKSNDIRQSGVEHFQVLTDQISNLNWAGGTSRPRYFQIRGIGENSHYFGEGPPNFSVGFVYDNIDLSGLGMVGFTHDISQVEVFKGAQSTIFGANSIGGFISINSNNPTEKLEARFNSSMGSDGFYNVGAIFNLNLSKKLGLRISSSKNYSNGFRENIFLGSKTTNKKDEIFNRIKLHFTPLKNLSFIGAYIYANQSNGYDIWAPDNNEKFTTYSDDLGIDSQITRGISLESNYQLFDNMKITSITSFSDVELNHSYDGDWANSGYWLVEHGFDPELEYYEYKFFDNNDRKRKNFTQELRTSIGSLVLGVYLNNLKEEDEASGYLYGGLATDSKSKYDFNSQAAYAQYEFIITKKLKLKTNIRYEENDILYKSQSEDNDYYTPIDEVMTEINSPMFGYSSVLSYSLNKSINYYAFISRGYKAGGINQEPNLSESNRTYDPEYILNGELGIKSYRNNFRNNLSVFYGARLDQQVSISSQQYPSDPNSFLFYKSNAAEGMISGLEIESKYYGNRCEIGMNLGYLRTWINQFEFDLGIDSSQKAGNRKMAMSPNLNGAISFLGYLQENLYVNIVNTYKSEYYFSDSHDYKSSSYNLTNISVGYSIRNIEINIWVRNLFNEIYETRGFYFGLIPPNFNDQLFKSFGDPRQSGLSINYNF
jgi:iron complex outermembrane recepter protein